MFWANRFVRDDVKSNRRGMENFRIGIDAECARAMRALVFCCASIYFACRMLGWMVLYPVGKVEFFMNWVPIS